MTRENRQPKLLTNIDCSKIKTGKNYRRFSRENLADLRGSIRRRGLIQPVILTINNNPKTRKQKPYELVAGERRFACCKSLKRPVKGILYEDLTRERFIAIQLAENTKRHINPGELAEASFRLYKELITEKLGLGSGKLDRFNPRNLSREYKKELPIGDFSVILGRDESTVRDYFDFVSLDRKVRNLVIEKSYDFGKAVILSKLPGDSQFQRAIEFDKTKKKDLEAAVKNILMQDDGDFNLTPLIERSNQYRKLNDFLNSLNKVIFAGVEYFKYSKKRFDTHLEHLVSDGLEILYEIKDTFEVRAEQEGKLERMLSMGEGKESYRKYVLQVDFDLKEKPASDIGGELMLIDTRLLDEDTEQPRQTYDPAKIEELEKSLKEVGQIQPCLVSPKIKDRYVVIDGNRRRRALRNIGVKKACCIVKEMNPIQRRIYQFESDFHEEDSPSERAEAIYRWTKLKQQEAELKGEKIEKKQLAERIGMSSDTVRRALNFVSASLSVKRMYGKGLLTYSAVGEISKIKQKDQRELGFKVYLRGRNVKTARSTISQYEFHKENINLFPESEINTGFGPVLAEKLEKHLHRTALLRLKEGDPLRASFIFKFYTVIKGLEKLKNYYHNR